jgi:hypothetical protein
MVLFVFSVCRLWGVRHCVVERRGMGPLIITEGWL